jgi:hypothetical protein
MVYPAIQWVFCPFERTKRIPKRKEEGRGEEGCEM